MKHYELKPLIISVALLAATPSLAGNTLVNGVAPRAQSLQAFVGVADDPSAIYYNPAGITQVKGTQLENGLSFVFPDQKYTNSASSPVDTTTTSTKKAIGGDLFLTTDALQTVTLGLGIYAPFARMSDYSENAATYGAAHFSDILRLDFSPTIAFNINDDLSIGFGPVFSRVSKRSEILGLYQKGSGEGYTAQAGILYKAPNDIKLGASYLGREHARVTGSGESAGEEGNFILYLNFPAVFRVGASWQINDQWMVSAGYDYEEWSYFKEAAHHYDNPTLNSIGTTIIDGKDSSDFRIGIDYKPWENGEILLGYTYSQAAIPADNIVPSQPDYDANYFAIGYSHYINEWRFDVGYEYGYMPNRSSDSAVFPGDYSMHVSSFMLGFAYNFTNNIV